MSNVQRIKGIRADVSRRKAEAATEAELNVLANLGAPEWMIRWASKEGAEIARSLTRELKKKHRATAGSSSTATRAPRPLRRG